MQSRVIAFFVIFLSKSIVSNAARNTDPLKIALEEFLADAIFEIVPCPPYPGTYYDAPYQCGYPTYPGCPAFYEPPSCQCGMPPYPWAPIYDPPCCQCGMPPCPWAPIYDPPCCQFAIPYPPPCNTCGHCGDVYPACSCYRDIQNPCAVYEDPAAMYICFDNFGCDCAASPPPYIYFPEVEYPMGVMDMKPYYYGSCWCS